MHVQFLPRRHWTKVSSIISFQIKNLLGSKSEDECNTYITVFAEICEQYGYLPVIEIDQNALKQILEKTQGNND